MSTHHDTDRHASETSKIKYYASGFILSLLFTLVAYVIVDYKMATPYTLYILVGAFALLQALVQVICFLRLNTTRQENRWNFISFLFTVLVIFILVGGCLWIMYNLNYNMGR